jgi:hypothetical protein
VAIDQTKPVRVFKNPKQGCYSIFQNGAVRASARAVRLGDVEFRVREFGRQKMLREQRRTIHAFAVGYLLDHVHPDEGRDLGAMVGRGVRYNPHEAGWFMDTETREPVTCAALVQFDDDGVTYRFEPLDLLAA